MIFLRKSRNSKTISFRAIFAPTKQVMSRKNALAAVADKQKKQTTQLNPNLMIKITNEDNMELMKRYPDNYFDLAIVDPPYGINIAASTNYGASGGADGRWKTKKKDFSKSKTWDEKTPTDEYFNELLRVSKNQIIWGWNYYVNYFDNCPSYIVWDKEASGNYSDCEMAWCSIKGTNKICKWLWNGFRKRKPEDRIHPTQKPVGLYSWLLQNYAKEGDIVLDTHIGSGSIAIAVDNANKIDKMNLTLVGCELDKDYYNATMKRIKKQTSWQSLF
jgi:site-specific DNA-methyltransferase (adenine-specific)